ncbi:hypothetical protein BC835DRAFT_387995 [Cytidiella melzeri]|nr:hypothetical protein BC835DRAFT_387995 [Cytidiella melzeri]
MPEAITKTAGYYEVLQLQPDATDDDIRVAYKKLALKWHPDRCQDNKDEGQKKFVEIQEAYLRLLEDRKRHRKHKSRKTKSGSQQVPSTSSAPSSTPSTCGSTMSSPHRKGSRTKEGKALKNEEQAHRPPDLPQSPQSTTTKLSRNASSTNTHSSKSEHVDSSEDEEVYPKKPHFTHKTPTPLEDTDYEFVDLVDLGSPLHPLRSPKSKDNVSKDWIFPLPLSLEDLYQGVSQHYRITRTLRSGSTQSVKIDIKVSPSWHTGTRIRVPGVGNERKDGGFQDIVFLVEVEPHPTFTRDGDDLVVSVQVPWADPHTRPYPAVENTGYPPEEEEEVYLKALDGQECALPIPRSLVEGADGTRIKGAGMPVRKHGKNVGKGDMVVKWEFIFSEVEKGHQRPTWRTFKRAMQLKL